MNLADQQATIQVDAPPVLPGQTDPGSSLATFDPGFQKAIAESLVTGAVVEMAVPSPLLPQDQQELDVFCQQALSGCPIGIELSFLDGRRMSVSLNWVVRDRSTVVSIRAADIT